MHLIALNRILVMTFFQLFYECKLHLGFRYLVQPVFCFDSSVAKYFLNNDVVFQKRRLDTSQKYQSLFRPNRIGSRIGAEAIANIESYVNGDREIVLSIVSINP